MSPANPIRSSHHRIILIRHARPEVSRKGLFSASAARQYTSDYDAASVEQFVLSHEAIPYKEIKKVHCSTLIRSQLTAKAIFGPDTNLVIDHTFREFERRVFSLPLLKLPISLWLLAARIAWFLGFNSSGIETFRQARQRAKAAAALLVNDAEQNQTAVLVAHGLLNFFIRKALQRMGWKIIEKGGRGYLGVTVLEKEPIA
ncbi:phosphoglycerate mutase family protein [Pontibacter vulgaris]|uniref:phosphoglycerate mutase family protein n=1 Tax=Pontibacter vulgaris TaxID=2905679 RepID=UPI001FA71E20|nr:phosphoglycerate mutase family protein [Pontibacter vulgaris]